VGVLEQHGVVFTRVGSSDARQPGRVGCRSVEPPPRGEAQHRSARRTEHRHEFSLTRRVGVCEQRSGGAVRIGRIGGGEDRDEQRVAPAQLGGTRDDPSKGRVGRGVRRPGGRRPERAVAREGIGCLAREPGGDQCGEGVDGAVGFAIRRAQGDFDQQRRGFGIA
jgi:hypothetical protein